MLPAFTEFSELSAYLEGAPCRRWKERLECEASLARVCDESLVAHCVPCGGLRRMAFRAVSGGDVLPNWREELACETCGLISRLRFSLAWIDQALRDVRDPRLYITEQVTPAYAWLKRRYPTVVGSEYLEPASRNPDQAGRWRVRLRRLSWYVQRLARAPVDAVRHENVTSLTLPGAHVDAVLCFDVLEHVPEYRAALHEFHRVLKPGGRLLVTVPFLATTHATLVRARLSGDGVEHFEEPEYHGDPLDAAGCLAFYTFGWELLDDLRAAGFAKVSLLDSWCPGVGHLGFVGAVAATKGT